MLFRACVWVYLRCVMHGGVAKQADPPPSTNPLIDFLAFASGKVMSAMFFIAVMDLQW